MTLRGTRRVYHGRPDEAPRAAACRRGSAEDGLGAGPRGGWGSCDELEAALRLRRRERRETGRRELDPGGPDGRPHPVCDLAAQVEREAPSAARPHLVPRRDPRVGPPER